jgi:hypothetical protein
MQFAKLVAKVYYFAIGDGQGFPKKKGLSMMSSLINEIFMLSSLKLPEAEFCTGPVGPPTADDRSQPQFTALSHDASIMAFDRRKGEDMSQALSGAHKRPKNGDRFAVCRRG